MPDIDKNRPLSGLAASGYDPATAQIRASVGSEPPERPLARRLLGRSIRRALLRFVCLSADFRLRILIYNAQLDPKTKKPQLESQLVLLKDGKQVFAGKLSPLTLGDEPDWKHIPASGRLRLGDDLAPGEYMLQIIVADKLAKEKERWVSQWMDFEIAK
jgi:hypothetical protein